MKRGQNTKIDLDDWLKYGYKNGFCGPPICPIHDNLPLTAIEAEDIWDGGEPCIAIVRIYNSKEIKQLVENNHQASINRADDLDWNL